LSTQPEGQKKEESILIKKKGSRGEKKRRGEKKIWIWIGCEGATEALDDSDKGEGKKKNWGGTSETRGWSVLTLDGNWGGAEPNEKKETGKKGFPWDRRVQGDGLQKRDSWLVKRIEGKKRKETLQGGRLLIREGKPQKGKVRGKKE